MSGTMESPMRQHRVKTWLCHHGLAGLPNTMQSYNQHEQEIFELFHVYVSCRLYVWIDLVTNFLSNIRKKAL